MEKIVEINDLHRTFKITSGWFRKKHRTINALDGISFEIYKGEVFGLLGPNGAGKTTTIKILSTLLAPTNGTCKIFGYNTFGEEKEIRKKINFIFGGEMGIYRRISAKENLIYFANLYHVPEADKSQLIEKLLKLVGLWEKADIKVETYSKGMIQRLQIARGLVNNPDIIFLDEPSIGLDPVGARELRDLIKVLKMEGKTILLTTHYMYEADELCDRIAIINHGRLVALDTSENIKRKAENTSVLEIETLDGIDDDKIAEIKKIGFVEMVTLRNVEHKNIIEVQYACEHEITNNVLEIIKDIKILSIKTREASLEDAYITLIGAQNE